MAGSGRRCGARWDRRAPSLDAQRDTVQMKKLIPLLGLLLLGGCRVPQRVEFKPGDGWFIAEGTINHRPARLVMDTGSENIVLFRPAADRLGLRYHARASSDAKVSPGEVPFMMSDKRYRITALNQ